MGFPLREIIITTFNIILGRFLKYSTGGKVSVCVEYVDLYFFSTLFLPRSTAVFGLKGQKEAV